MSNYERDQDTKLFSAAAMIGLLASGDKRADETAIAHDACELGEAMVDEIERRKERRENG